jgi:hypothetical protein
MWSESCGILERNGKDPFKFDAELLVKKGNHYPKGKRTKHQS